MVFVSRLEDKLPVVPPFQSAWCLVLWLCVAPGVVPSPVLHHHGLYLCLGVGHSQRVVRQLHGYLLVGEVGVDVGICGGAHRYSRLRVYHHETCREHLFARVSVGNRDLVVAAELQSAFLVGYGEGVVGVVHVCVYGFRDVVYRVVFGKSFYVIACEELLRRRPVGFTMGDAVGVAVVCVCQVVE